MARYPVTQNGIPDRRYSIAQEFCGYEKPRYVLRFCGDFIASSSFYSSLVTRAVCHNAARLGAVIITAKES